MRGYITLVCDVEERAFKLGHAQNILEWQVRHPKTKQTWKIKEGEPYVYDQSTNELRKQRNTKEVQKPASEARDTE